MCIRNSGFAEEPSARDAERRSNTNGAVFRADTGRLGTRPCHRQIPTTASNRKPRWECGPSPGNRMKYRRKSTGRFFPSFSLQGTHYAHRSTTSTHAKSCKNTDGSVFYGHELWGLGGNRVRKVTAWVMILRPSGSSRRLLDRLKTHTFWHDFLTPITIVSTLCLLMLATTKV